MTEPLLFPAFLYGELSPTQRKMKAEAKKWGKRYAKSGDFPEPKLMSVPFGSIVFWNRYALEFRKSGMSTENDPEWAKVWSAAGPNVPRWHLHHLEHFWTDIPTVERGREFRHPMFKAYETFVQRYPWGALVIAMTQPLDNPIPVAIRRIEALLSFWEQLDTIRYVDVDFYPVSLTDFVLGLYRELVVMWVDRPTGDLRVDLRTVISAMPKASEDEIRSRALRSACWFIETWPHLKHRQWLKTPGLLERELERLRVEEPDNYADLATLCGSLIVCRLDRVGPNGVHGSPEKTNPLPAENTASVLPNEFSGSSAEGGPSVNTMGGRGHTLHVPDSHASGALRRIGHRIAILGSNERWTSFLPVDAADFDDERASAALDHPILHIWFDDDSGVVLQVYAAGNLVGEFSLPGDEPSSADLELLQKLETLGILTSTQRAALIDRISMADGYNEWTLAHGLEKLLELPFYLPIPDELSESELRSMLPEIAILTPLKKSRKAPPRTPKQTTPSSRTHHARKESWSEQEMATVALHCEYWSTIFSLNNWTLYHRYKKHLPADQRRDVDLLAEFIAKFDDNDEVMRRVQDILARIWDCEDWDAFIRDPKLEDGDEPVWQEWLRRLSQT